MLTPTQAIKNAVATTRYAVGMCDNFVAKMYGYSSSGYATAASHWAGIPVTEKHPGDTNPPAGALVFWSGGSSGAGHVAISTGGGNIISTDYPRSGMVSATTLSSISNGWGEHYLGWSVPVFQGQVSQASFPASGATNPLGNLLGGSVGSTLLSSLTDKFGVSVKDMFERLGLFVLGGILVTIGILNIQDKSIKTLIKGPMDARKTAKDTADKEAEETSDAVDKEGESTEAEVGE